MTFSATAAVPVDARVDVSVNANVDEDVDVDGGGDVSAILTAEDVLREQERLEQEAAEVGLFSKRYCV
jgi:hypothetical protein